MTIAFVLEEGEYSSYRILGIYTSALNALMARDKLYPESTMVEWEMDYNIDRLLQGYRFYQVEMMKNGNSTIRSEEPREEEEFYITTRSTYHLPRLIANLWATSEEHAAKICIEKRAMFIASGEL